jgi:ribosome-associated protein
MTQPASRIAVNGAISIGVNEIAETFIRASGPGGQNVNKVSSAVQLRFDVRRSPSLPDAVRTRLERLAGHRLTREGILVIQAQRHRSQPQNRLFALELLIDLIRQAAVPPVRRMPTRPTFASKERRLVAKRLNARTKDHRRVSMSEDR